MAQKASNEIKAPKSFEDIRELVREYDYMQGLIKKSAFTEKTFLGFINDCYDDPGINYETLDSTWGKVFADCLRKRCEIIKDMILKSVITNSI